VDTVEIPATVTVLGTARARTEPDEAMLWIGLDALADAPGPALSDVSARSDSLIKLLDELGIPARDRSTAGIGVQEEFDHTSDGRASLGHRATARVSVRLTDPQPMGRLIARATDELGARIDGPRWVISPDNPARLEVAQQASAAAWRKAEAYAKGVGVKLGRLVALREPGTQVPVTRTAFAAVGYRPGGEMPIESGEHEVVAGVEATFTLERV
jgi:uncharacterized protein